MGMKTIAKYMYFSRAIDMTPEKDRFFLLPESGLRRTMRMSARRAGAFSAACSRRVLGLVPGIHG